MDVRPSAVLAVALALAPGCGASGGVEPCGQIPEGGCPVGRGGTCDDATCAALHDCLDGTWTEVETCANPVGAGGAGGSGEGGGSCEAPVFDRTGEADGCEPDLLEPDCPIAAAEVCPDPCLTGCADFFLCTAEGWIDVAACDESGVLQVFR